VCGGGDPAQADKLARLPIWAFHGDANPLVPVGRARDLIAALKKAGGEPQYPEYQGVGHDAWAPTYTDGEVLDWLFGQKQGN
jgi:predicted peptidase